MKMNIAKKSGSSSSEHIHDTTHTHLENPLHDRIQFKFDAVFPRSSTGKKTKSSSTAEMDLGSSIDDIPESKSHSNESTSDGALNEISLSGLELNLDSTGTTQTESLPSNSESSESNGDFSFDLDGKDREADSQVSSATPASASDETSVLNTTTTGIDFSNEEISFDVDSSQAPNKKEVVNKPEEKVSSEISFGADDDISFDLSSDESSTSAKPVETPSQKASESEDDGLDFSFDFDQKNDETSSNVNLMSTSEDMSNISDALESIVTPAATVEAEAAEHFNEFAASSPEEKVNADEDFDFGGVEFADKEGDIIPSEMKDVTPQAQFNPNPEKDEDYDVPPPAPVEVTRSIPSTPVQERVGFISEEDSTRVHATIRQMREEREELLNQIKQLRGHSKEVEQDNLTLKAALDESKIENSIIKKRHLVEIEDIKYRMAISDEKRAIAEEKAKNSENNRMKLEQKVRIDFNQVKQREKELETKLEMLTLDIDSQVQTRDQKILELRRKIDSLEFNMENVSIREQKSQEDKRKLEDKLSKIMKTLRHSIKNLEDDIDQMAENEDEIKIKE